METSGQRSSMSAMQFALEALDSDNPDMQLRAAIALRQALETEQEPVCAHGVEKTKCDFCQSKQEPVAWISEGGDVSRSKRYMDEMGFKCNPLYTAPPKKEWVGLTGEEIKQTELSLRQYNSRDTYDLSLQDFADAIEAKLKEKNHGQP